MLKKIEKQLEQFVRSEIAGIHRIQMTNGTMYLVLDKPSDCDFVHKEIRTFYKENINPDGGVNMYAVGDEFAFDFVPADAEAPVFTDEQVSDIDIALNYSMNNYRYYDLFPQEDIFSNSCHSDEFCSTVKESQLSLLTSFKIDF